MKRLAFLLLAAVTASAPATVLFLEPFGLAIGGSTESEVRGRLGNPRQRAVSPDGVVTLTLSSHEPNLREIEAALVPDTENTPRLQRISIVYREPRESSTLRVRFHLSKPQWEQQESFGALHCRVEYHQTARLSAHQRASMSLAFCHEKSAAQANAVTVLTYFSSSAFDELAQRHIAATHQGQVRWGYIDRSGRFVLPRAYDEAGTFAANAALVRSGGAYRHIDRKGQPVREVYTGEPSYEEVALQPREVNGKWGFADASGRLAIPAVFDDVEPFQEQRAAAMQGGRWGFINEQGAWIIAAQFMAVRSFFEGLAAVNRDGLWGYIDRYGRLVVSPRFTGAGDFGEGLAPVK